MLFRRIKAHVEKENWFAVGVDFAIVVIGVFIGLQVANWNEARGEQARGEDIKVRLAAEFIELEPKLARHVRNVTTWRDLADGLAEDVLTGSIDLQSQEFADRSLAINWHMPTGGSNTVTELINRGDLDLLGSPDLVELLLEFHSTAVRHIGANDALVREAIKYRKRIWDVSILAAITPERRSDAFTVGLAERASAPDIYVMLVNMSLLLQVDLDWHQTSLEMACDILQELDEPCRANNALALGDTP